MLKKRKTIAILLFISIVVVLFINWYQYKKSLFTKEKWSMHMSNPVQYNYYPGRELCINDLLNNYQLKELNYSAIIQLLGAPDYYTHQNKECTLHYQIVTECISDIDPDHIQYLLIVFTEKKGKVPPETKVKRLINNDWYAK